MSLFNFKLQQSVYFKTVKQSEDSLKIFRTPKCYAFTGIQELFPSCFSFSRGTIRAPAIHELRLDAHEITAKKALFRLRFSVNFKHQISFFKLKSLRRFVINVTYSEENVVFLKTC